MLSEKLVDLYGLVNSLRLQLAYATKQGLGLKSEVKRLEEDVKTRKGKQVGRKRLVGI